MNGKLPNRRNIHTKIIICVIREQGDMEERAGTKICNFVLKTDMDGLGLLSSPFAALLLMTSFKSEARVLFLWLCLCISTEWFTPMKAWKKSAKALISMKFECFFRYRFHFSLFWFYTFFRHIFFSSYFNTVDCVDRLWGRNWCKTKIIMKCFSIRISEMDNWFSQLSRDLVWLEIDCVSHHLQGNKSTNNVFLHYYLLLIAHRS